MTKGAAGFTAVGLGSTTSTATQIQPIGKLPKCLFLAGSDPKAMCNAVSNNTANTVVFRCEKILN